MNKRRLFSFFLACCLIFSALSVQAFAAEESADAKRMDLSNAIWYAPGDEGGGSVYEDEAGALFYESAAALQKIPAGTILTGDEKIIYDAVVPFIRQIANGERASAIISIGKNYEESPADVSAEFTGRDITETQFALLINALLADFPYELFWYDKVSGSALIPLVENGKLTQVILFFTVANNYRGEDEFTADCEKTSATKTAAANAKAIVDKYADKTDYEKLLGYKNEICALVEYDFNAANNYTFTTDIDPWQLVSVFDGNPNTNVVCEGYAKAFMYLCEISDFKWDVSCYIVMGRMDGILHMWNIVDIGGSRYLVDVTNSDSGTIGENGSLFLAGSHISSPGVYYWVAGIYYEYDEGTKNLWGTGHSSILKIEISNYDPSTEPVLDWEYKDGVLTVSSGKAIPNFLSENNRPWNEYAESITSVIVKNGVEYIGQYAFSGCTALREVTLPDGLLEINNYAFRGCTALETIDIPNSVTGINCDVFSGCSSLKELSLPEGLKMIGDDAFNNCKSLTKVEIPASVQNVGMYAFQGCSRLKEVIIAEGVGWIGACAFRNCGSLETIEIPSSITCIESETFYNCASLEKVILHYGLTKIDKSAFGLCLALEAISIPDSVTKLGDLVFNNCTALKEVSLSDRLQEMGHSVFERCSSLEEIEVPDSVRSIGGSCFSYCTSLKEIVIPNSVTNLGGGVFNHCSALERVVLSENLKMIRNKTFADCKLLKEVKIPSGVTMIDQGAFSGCSSLSEIVIPNTVSTIGAGAFSNCDVLAEVIIPDSVKTIGEQAFSHCASLEKMVLPSGLLKLEKSTFRGCENLREITLPEGLVRIGEWAFADCVSLADVIIPKTVTHIDGFVFYGCNSLESAHYLGSKKPQIDSDNEKLLEILHYCANTGTAPTCEEPGMEGGIYCEECGRVFKEGTPAPAKGHKYDHDYDVDCNNCGKTRKVDFKRPTMDMYRMYDPNSGEHFYTGSTEERDHLISVGWDYEGVGFTFPLSTGKPVYRLYEPISGEHLYTMDEAEKATLISQGWNLEGVAFNSGFEAEVPQYRLHNPNATRGAYHFTASEKEREILIALGWEYQGIGWYSFGTKPVE